MFSASTSLARAAVWYSIRHRVLSRSGMSRRDSARADRGAGYRAGGVGVLAAPSGAGRQDRGGQPALQVLQHVVMAGRRIGKQVYTRGAVPHPAGRPAIGPGGGY